MTTPIVTWTTPAQAALAAFHAGCEALETGTREEALAFFAEHQRHFNDLIAYLQREAMLASGELIADFPYDKLVAAMKHRRPYPRTTT